MGKVCCIETRYVRVVVGQIGTDRLGMDTLKIVICLSVGGNGKVKVTCAHIQRIKLFANDSVGTCKLVRSEYGLALRSVLFHYFKPANKFLGFAVIYNVGAIHHGGWMDRGIRVFRVRRNDKSEIFPVIEICGLIASHAPMPDSVIGFCEFLVLSVPVVRAVKVHHGTAVCLDTLALGIKPYLSGANRIITCGFHESSSKY